MKRVLPIDPKTMSPSGQFASCSASIIVPDLCQLKEFPTHSTASKSSNALTSMLFVWMLTNRQWRADIVSIDRDLSINQYLLVKCSIHVEQRWHESGRSDCPY
ncbi:hypothetical protein RRG08_004563 [Elysia crispata]|uniref:Uncharacterized protein n=1 Tax=Elysia crispata TaxID=231223 RepID=A0AAE1ALR3_9GAST|nr:hypothetical protein RRG08_004563 [Elysia crispata]